jgi:hypothetical protein
MFGTAILLLATFAATLAAETAQHKSLNENNLGLRTGFRELPRPLATRTRADFGFTSKIASNLNPATSRYT